MYRHIRLTAAATPTPTTKAQALAIGLFSGIKTLPVGYTSLDQRTGGALSAALGRAEFSARKGECTALYPARGFQRVFVLGLGEEKAFSPSAVRAAGSKLLTAAFAARVDRVDLHLDEAWNNRLEAVQLKGSTAEEVLGRALGDGLTIANCDFDQFKGAGQPPTTPKKPTHLALTLGVSPRLRPHVQRALDIGTSLNLARGLAMTPPNIANPAYLAAFCRKIARAVNLRCTVIDARRARKLGLNGLLAVGGAGSTPPALICLEWNGADAAPSGRKSQISSLQPILLVGKAITFDTGGYSIKPAESLDKMKYDKCGGLAVIGAMHAIARLKLPVHIVGLVSAAENMIAPTAYRPADILRMFNGVTVEVTNTDAEGRLVLADALAYGCKTYQPRAVIDLATLTGGVVVALGSYSAGMFCTSRDLRGRLFDAADFTGERLWHLPLWDEHRQQMKGGHGDIINSAGREASPIQGAAFLSYFTGKDGKPHTIAPAPGHSAPAPSSKIGLGISGGDSNDEPAWAHLDIAGMVDARKDDPVFPPGPTGFGVRLLVRTIEAWNPKG